ncbi:hypothetical protein AMECASPLE_025211 [Ameca splendens]|uniref:Uncharacterized protein n=1 Tax=Ameca splendens TaxID=208324 RepID=A0ABV0Z2X9_9TELE
MVILSESQSVTSEEFTNVTELLHLHPDPPDQPLTPPHDSDLWLHLLISPNQKHRPSKGSPAHGESPQSSIEG